MSKTLRQLLNIELQYNNETFDDIVYSTLTDQQLEKVMSYNSYYPKFTIWTKQYIYFPINISYHSPADYVEDCSIIESVPRAPGDYKTDINIAV